MKLSKVLWGLAFSFILFQSDLKAQVNVTFLVDVSLYLDSGNVLDTAGMRIGGKFSSLGINNIPDWTPSSPPCKMTPMGFNRWKFTVQYPDSAKGKFQDFKFVNGNWGPGKDERSPSLAGCGYISGGVVNRRITIPNQDSTYSYCWNSCNACPVQFVVSTGTATSITGSTATVTGFVTGSGILEQGICYGTNPNPTITNSYTYFDQGAGNGAFSAPLSMLNPGTQYYFRAFARKSNGYTYGSIGNFTTMAPGQLTSITYKVNISNFLAEGNILHPEGIRIAGDFMRRGVRKGNFTVPDWIPLDSTCAMENMGNNIWAITLQYPDSSLGKIQRFLFTNGPLASAESSDSLVSGGCALNDGAGIRRVYTIPFSSSTREYCWDRCGNLCNQTVPGISGSQQGTTSFHSAAFSATVTGIGISMRGFCYSVSPAPDTSDFVVNAGSGSGNFTASLEGLTPNTTYYARAFALNAAGISYGPELTFSTAQAFSVIYRVDVSAYVGTGNVIGPNGIRIGGNFADQGCALPNWTPSNPACAMNNDGNDMWSITVFYPDSAAGKTQRYKFVNNDWGTNEGSQNLVIGACGVQDGNDVNRILSLQAGGGIYSYCWDGCGPSCLISIKDIKSAQAVQVWPNPFEGTFHIESMIAQEFEIINVLGKTEFKSKMKAGLQEITVPELKKGLYFLRTTSGKTIPVFHK